VQNLIMLGGNAPQDAPQQTKHTNPFADDDNDMPL
jgi:hypothetical protein